MRKGWLVLALFSILAVLLANALGRGWLGRRHGAGEITHQARPEGEVAARLGRQRAAEAALDRTPGKQILFGDLHVHSTFSTDAFAVILPMYHGEGAHPPADACDFARFCSALDFWSINDHAEGLTPRQWSETKDSVRQCNAVAGDAASPDLVTFLGWEWTQIGGTPQDHYGHKNVILRETAERSVPARPIASRRDLFPKSSGARPIGPWLRFALIAGSPASDDRRPYMDFARFMQDREDVARCPEDVPTRELPADCMESAPTPGELFRRLDDWGYPYLVIPHGNAWGIYTPPGTSWDKQLAQHTEPERHEPLLEVFSGHGSSEEYRPWRAVSFDANGWPRCPPPSDGYTPECWRAGEIIRARCLAADETAGECERRASEARRNHVQAGMAGHLTVPGARAEDWLDAGQCSDCYMPAYNYRPGGASQYALAISDFDGPGPPKRFRFGFIASSDNHTARPGTGYKERDRWQTTDATLGQMGPPRFEEVEPEPRSLALSDGAGGPVDFERSSSFFGTAGLVAVHSAGRDRDAIWEALERREVYGTSGDRMLLWFDWVGPAPDGQAGSAGIRPMGSLVTTREVPHFRVRAAGALRQREGCPESSVTALGADEIQRLCRGECYHPSDERKTIARIEVIRIRPQIRPGEPVESLIEDPWRVLSCEPDPAGCSVEFSDPEFAVAGRDTTYYVRAIQQASPTINGAGLRCTRDEAGRCVSTEPCYGDGRTDYEDDCLADAEERAWSSPLYLLYGDEP